MTERPLNSREQQLRDRAVPDLKLADEIQKAAQVLRELMNEAVDAGLLVHVEFHTCTHRIGNRYPCFTEEVSVHRKIQ